MIVFDMIPHDYVVFRDGVEQAEVATQAEAERLSSDLKSACETCVVRYIEPGNYLEAVIDSVPPPPPPPPSGNSDLALAAATLAPGESAPFNMGGLDFDLISAEPGATIITYSTKGYWNPVTKTIEFGGQGHTGDVKHIRWDDKTNQWSIVATNGSLPFIGHGYEHTALNPQTGEVFFSEYHSNRVYEGQPPYNSIGTTDNYVLAANAIEYFPEADALVWLDWNADYLWWRKNGQWEQLSFSPFSTAATLYESSTMTAVTGKILFGGNRRMWSLDPSGNVSAEQAPPINIGPSSSSNIMLQDPTDAGAALLIGVNGGVWRWKNGWSQSDTIDLIGNPEDHIAVSIPDYGVVLLIEGLSPTAQIYRPQ